MEETDWRDLSLFSFSLSRDSVLHRLFFKIHLPSSQVMYDATSSSPRGPPSGGFDQLIVELLEITPLTDSRPLRDSLGHTPVQAAVGALLGMVVGYAHFNMWLISQGVDL